MDPTLTGHTPHGLITIRAPPKQEKVTVEPEEDRNVGVLESSVVRSVVLARSDQMLSRVPSRI